MTLHRISSIGLLSMICLIGGCITDDGGKNSTVTGNAHASTAQHAPTTTRRTELENKRARVERKIEQKERKKKKALLDLQRDYIQRDLDELYQQRASLQEELNQLNQATTPASAQSPPAPAVPAK